MALLSGAMWVFASRLLHIILYSLCLGKGYNLTTRRTNDWILVIGCRKHTAPYTGKNIDDRENLDLY